MAVKRQCPEISLLSSTVARVQEGTASRWDSNKSFVRTDSISVLAAAVAEVPRPDAVRALGARRARQAAQHETRRRLSARCSTGFCQRVPGRYRNRCSERDPCPSQQVSSCRTDRKRDAAL